MPRNGKFADDGLVTDLSRFLRDKVYNVDGVNLVPNSSFETFRAGADNTGLVGWGGVGGPTARIGTDSRAARSGAMGLVIRPGAGSTSSLGVDQPSGPGRVYEVSVWCKLIEGADAAARAGIAAYFYNAAGSLVKETYPFDTPFSAGVGNWVRYTRTVPAPVNAATVKFGVWAQASTTNLVGFDDIFVEDVTIKERAKQEVGVTTLSDFGGDPTGLTSSDSAFRAAIAATPAGGTLRVPKGYYKRTPYTTPTGEGSYIVIDKPINIVGEPGTVMEDFLLYFKGAFDSPLAFGSNAIEGDRMISTSVPHGWNVGDYVQVMSQYNVYSAAAGVYQLGSTSPTTGTTPTVRTGEIHRVGHVPNTVNLNLDKTLMFGAYGTGTEVRRIRTLDGVTIQGIRFVNTQNANYRGILARGCSNLVIRNCDFVSGSNAGSSVKIYDSIGTRIIGGSIIKYLDVYTGSSWNTIIIGGGCTDTIIEGVYAEGGAQTIDFSPLLGNVAADVGASEPEGRTVQGMVVRGCTFRNCGDAFTTHPGTMGLVAHGNDIQGGSTGIRVRSRRSVVRNNTIRTARAGISLSGFVHDSLVANNDLVHLPSAAFPGYYHGISYYAVSSEIDNGNSQVHARIKGNVVVVKNAVSPLSRAIILSYANIGGYTISDAWKKNSGVIHVEDNTLRGGGIEVGDAINANRILNNTFQGGNDSTHRIVCLSVANVITGNNFIDNGPHIKLGPVPVAGEYGYGTLNRVGGNNYQYPVLNELVNNAPTYTEA